MPNSKPATIHTLTRNFWNMKSQVVRLVGRTGSLAVLLSAVALTTVACVGCGDSSPELSSTNDELEAFLEEHPGGLSEDVVIEGQE
ncbi:hypothetical protein SAMN06265222_11669 [Neorhodopirellula lusitana]|uniref:Secreted protein n=2 Tax=Neorhodopirellula lusitana TaxID=445327 RepID=A0ABY1QNH5_9BACT|nr:hypothetical protein SAMN06265222_11669 [Neorhodopirellula lusitana]